MKNSQVQNIINQHIHTCLESEVVPSKLTRNIGNSNMKGWLIRTFLCRVTILHDLHHLHNHLKAPWIFCSAIQWRVHNSLTKTSRFLSRSFSANIGPKWSKGMDTNILPVDALSIPDLLYSPSSSNKRVIRVIFLIHQYTRVDPKLFFFWLKYCAACHKYPPAWCNIRSSCSFPIKRVVRVIFLIHLYTEVIQELIFMSKLLGSVELIGKGALTWGHAAQGLLGASPFLDSFTILIAVTSAESICGWLINHLATNLTVVLDNCILALSNLSKALQM